MIAFFSAVVDDEDMKSVLEQVEGSMAGFVGVCAAFSLMTATFGLMIAALGKTPEATRGLSIFVTLIMVMLGGSWVNNPPPWS